ncbi:hypothetical protein Taro_011693 [Colocasia esculenta]|uniref:Uncharacterized protein n=1 Tax=Colocasia esculenta TaxID=4460 RepID=A0A843U6L8_COLES|nr:hypothetical protein [Colocasia esculenta]
MISLIVQERLLGFVLGASVVGVAVLEQHRAIYRSISAQNQAPAPPEVKALLDRRKSNVDFAHMWNKAVDGAFGPVISALSSRGW